MSREHLDPDTMSAFAEHSLNASEEAKVFSHLAECEICRQYLAVHSELRPSKRGVHPLVFKTAAVLAGMAVTAGVLFHSRPSHAPAQPQAVAMFPRFNEKVRLTSLEFGNRKTGPKTNQIRLMTPMGERWVTVRASWKAMP